jgi:O-antigen/teichoic acid export membrane protein
LKKYLNHKVFKNFSYLTIGSIVSQLLMLVTVLRITKILLPDDYGLYTFMISQGTLLYALSDLGIKTTTIRAIARKPEATRNYALNGAIMRLLSLVFFFLVYVVYNNLLGSFNSFQLVLIAIYGLIYSFFHLFEYIFLGNQRMLYPSVVKIIHSGLWFLIIFLLPEHLFSANFLMVAFLIISTVKTYFLYNRIQKLNLLIGTRGEFLKNAKMMLKESWPYITMMLFNLPFAYFSNNFLDVNSTNDEIGFFNLATKLMGPVQIIISFSLTALFPNISQLFVKDKKSFLRYVSTGVPAFVFLIGYFSFIFSFFSKEGIQLLFTEEYLPAIPVTQLQIWFVFFHGINHLITIIFGAADLEKKIFNLSLVNFLIATPMLYAGSFYGALGISYGYVVSFAIFQIYIWWQLKKNLQITFNYEYYLWLMILVLFAISYVLVNYFDLWEKILLSGILTGVIALIFYKNAGKIFPKKNRNRVDQSE